MQNLTDQELTFLNTETYRAVREARSMGPVARNVAREAHRRVTCEQERRRWNLRTVEERAKETVEGAQQWAEEGPYFLAFRAWEDGVATAVEACQRHGISLADR